MSSQKALEQAWSLRWRQMVEAFRDEYYSGQFTMTSIGSAFPVDPSIDCRCLGCKIEATASKSSLMCSGWSDIEINPERTDGSHVGICMREECRKKFGLPAIQSNLGGI